jgi:cytosine/uracil/thiamine/allantoin permease
LTGATEVVDTDMVMVVPVTKENIAENAVPPMVDITKVMPAVQSPGLYITKHPALRHHHLQEYITLVVQE